VHTKDCDAYAIPQVHLLKSVLEANLSLNGSLDCAPINFLILQVEEDSCRGDEDDDEELQTSRDPETSQVAWGFFLAMWLLAI
jgi:hypothetical protein